MAKIRCVSMYLHAVKINPPQKLKEFTWGSPNMPPKAEWEKQGVVFHTSDQLFAYGLKCPKNSVKNFMLCLEAYFLKHLLFEKTKKGAQR